MQDLPQTKKALGQHWLHDVASLEAMCNAADVGSGDMVLEVGPGTGTLTRRLLDRGATVTAVELDESLIQELRKNLTSKDFEVVHKSILEFDFTTLPTGYKLVANIPYYLTSNLIRVLSESDNPPVVAVILVQKEVALRVAAVPGDMSLLSVTAQYYWETSVDMVVPAHLFTPPPKVDSQILVLRRRSAPLFENVDDKKFFKLIKAGFINRRKTLENSLSGGLHLSKPDARELLTSAGLALSRRPQELSLQEWHDLYVAVQNNLGK